MASSPAPASAVTNLPAPLTRFVGREIELAEATALLAENRLLTLTGPGGSGKTRLALRLASAVAEDFPEGVWFVDFSPLSGGGFVWDEVAMTLGVRQPGPGSTLAEAVRRHLARRQALVVLDNCEHVVETAAEVAAGLLAAAPALKVVATSREPLEVGGEVTWAVPPLSDGDALELFSERARQARPQFKLRPEDADAVRFICRRLDGLPLAIELAAARTRALAPVRIAAHIKDHFRVLPGGPRLAPGRQATLRASFEWSYELLSEAERALLCQLSVFAGGFDVEAVLAICPAASIELLAGLVDRSLIVVDHRSDQAEPHYRMLETIREFAAERLAEAQERDMVSARHRDHYLGLAEAAEPKVLGPEQVYWLPRLSQEQDNLRGALAWSRDQGEADALARIVVALGNFWAMTARWIEAQVWLEAAADRAHDLSPRLRGRLRNLECVCYISSGRSLAEVPALANEALELARAAGDEREEALALFTLGLVAGLVGGAEAMRPYIEQALPLARSAGFAQVAVPSLPVFVVLRWFQSEPEQTWRLAEEAIAIAKAGGNRQLLLLAMCIAGLTAVVQGRLAAAHKLLEAAMADGRHTDHAMLWNGLLGLAWVRMLRGDFAAARAAVAESLAASQRSAEEGRVVRTIEPHARWILGSIELVGGCAAQARDTLAPVVDFFRSSLVSPWAAPPLVVMAEAQLELGALDEAQASLEEATSLARAGALTWVLGRAALVRAKLRVREGDLKAAESLAHEALSLAREAGDQLGLVDGLELLARLVAEQESAREAVRLWSAAESLRAELGYARFPVDRGVHESALAQAAQALGQSEFAAAWAEGVKLSPDAAIAYAARGRGERRRPSNGWASLTPSELEVVRLVGQHLTNPEIAARLFVSRATIKTHLLHVFAKLGVASRSELASEAIKAGILGRQDVRR
ncbi:MAG TPA: LuxR C-terminal-related transcriptional regulator [Candidatus Dormibacteraeota bacterium]|nr:LuxR C-terminal-related transcriptional regulator [Candidatus Dormibacteraeota bacterium]